MPKSLSSLLMAVVMLGGLGGMRPAPVSLQIGPPPARPHVWVSERRFWHGRREVRGAWTLGAAPGEALGTGALAGPSSLGTSLLGLSGGPQVSSAAGR